MHKCSDLQADACSFLSSTIVHVMKYCGVYFCHFAIYYHNYLFLIDWTIFLAVLKAYLYPLLLGQVLELNDMLCLTSSLFQELENKLLKEISPS